MPFRSKKKRRLYAEKWRRKHPRYMRDYNRAYYYEEKPTCLLRQPKPVEETPAQGVAEIRAGLQLPTNHAHTS